MPPENGTDDNENHDQKSLRNLKFVHAYHEKPYKYQLLQFILFMVQQHVVALTKYLPQILWLNILLTHACKAY